MADWIARAVELGAHAAQVISPEQVVTAEWVRLKCQYGCGGYGECLTCPPYSPTPETTRRVLRHYRQALLLRVEGQGGEDEEERLRRRLNEAVVTLEREVFLDGHYYAWSMTAGPCLLCKRCNLKGPCRHPHLARPSMEACGVDVFTTVRRAGWEIEVVRSPEFPFRLFGLVLVE